MRSRTDPGHLPATGLTPDEQARGTGGTPSETEVPFERPVYTTADGQTGASG